MANCGQNSSRGIPRSGLVCCVVRGRQFVPLKHGFYATDNFSKLPPAELHILEELNRRVGGSGHDLVQHEDHWDYLVDNRLYHLAETCCSKECIPSKHGFIFSHGDASVLRNRKGQEDSSTADLTEIVTTPQEEGRHLAADASSSTKIYVEGMCCSSEATTIHDILDRLPGVLQVDVSVITKSAIIKHTEAVQPSTLVTCLNHAHLEAYLELPRRQGKLRFNKLPSWNVLLAAFFLVVSLFHYMAGRVDKPKMEYMKWIALGSIVVALPRIVLKAFASLKLWRLDINFLMTVAIGGALALQEVTDAAAVVVLFSLADWLESSCTSSARNAIAAVLALKPELAVVASSGAEVPADGVEIGTCLLVRPGEKIAIDGKVTKGSSNVDQMLLTGESRPVRKIPGQEVMGGTTNCGASSLEYCTSTSAGESAVARMAVLVEQAVSKKSAMESTMTRFAAWFTPIIILACLGIVVIPIAAGANDRNRWINLSLQILVTACPCALVLSTPVTVVAGLAASARQGVLIKGGQHLEALAKVKTVTLDKTGTLTKGQFRVVWEETFQGSSEQLMMVAGSLEHLSTHPIAACIVASAANAGVQLDLDVDAFENVPGLGLVGIIQGKEAVIGNTSILALREVSFDTKIVDELASTWGGRGASICFVAYGGQLIGAIAVADAPRVEAAEAIQRLQNLGVTPKMLTGDAAGPAYAIAAGVGLPAEDVHAALLPEDKLIMVEELQEGGNVLHVGDGINDAPALAAASVGISMGTSGAAIAVEAGDITLFTNDLRCLSSIVRLGQTVRNLIIFNIAICVATKIAVLVLAALGRMTLWGAILVDVGTACIVCLNGMQCMRWNIATGSIWDWRQAKKPTACVTKAGNSCSSIQCEDGRCSDKVAACPPKKACCSSKKESDPPACAANKASCSSETESDSPVPAPKKACCSSRKESDSTVPALKKACCSSKKE